MTKESRREMPIPFVSVIIPVYNDPDRLKICLQALEEQSYPKDKYEVIVVDNRSDESIEPIVTEFSQAKASCETRPGQFTARNKGLLLAQGEVLGFTDSDCVPASDWIEKGVKTLLSIPNCGIAGGKVKLFFKDPEHPTVSELYDRLYYLNQKFYIEKKNFSVTANFFTYKHVFDHVGKFDENVEASGDMEWGMRVASCGYPLIYAVDACVAHPARHSFKQLQKKVEQASRGTAKVHKKHNISLLLNWDFLIGLAPPLRKVIRLRKNNKASIPTLIKFVFMWFLLEPIIIKERLRVMLQKDPQNR